MPETLKPFNAFFAYLAVRAGAFALLVFGSLASATPLEEERVQTRLNWTPLKQIAKSERDERCLKCRGKYTDPLADVDRSISPNESDLEVGAGDSDITDDTLFFSDAVTVTQGYRTLKAEAVTIDRVEQTVTATGPIEVREPGIVMYGDTISYNSIDEQAQLTNAEFVLYEQQLYGIAEEVTRDANGTLTIDEGDLTFCSPTDPSWLVSAESLEIDAITNTGEAWGARIDIKG
ncbi:MAG: LptA/OstA family protein, partial [Gammaproteobacteria bacterium]